MTARHAAVVRQPRPLFSNPCPTGWNCADIGSSSPAGDQSLSNGNWTITGAGNDYAGTSDQFHYVWQPVSGDNVTQFLAGPISSPYSQCAMETLMYRDSTNSNGAFYGVSLADGGSSTGVCYGVFNQNYSIHIDYRTSDGGAVTDMLINNQSDLTQPTSYGGLNVTVVYIKIVRTGNTFTSYADLQCIDTHNNLVPCQPQLYQPGPDQNYGHTWEQIDNTANDKITINMPNTALVGMAVLSSSTTYTAQAGFGSMYTAAPPTVYLGVHPASFYPQTGQYATITAAATGSNPSDPNTNPPTITSITIANSSGSQVQSFTPQGGQKGQWAWNGTNSNNTTVPPGVYTVAVTATAPDGLSSTSTSQIDVLAGPVEPSQTGGGPVGDPPTVACQGDPVNCATGEFWHTLNDLSIPGRGEVLDLSRTYSSQLAAQEGPFGYGWTDSYNMYLSQDGTGDITVNEENGSAVQFLDVGGTYFAPPYESADLVKNADGTFTLTRKTREQFVFNGPSGTPPFALIKEIDRNGYTTTLTYDGSSRLGMVTDPAGRALAFHYTGTSTLVTSVTDSAGRTVGYTYNSSGELTSVTDVNNGVTSFTYTTSPIPHLLLSMTDPVQSAEHGSAQLKNVYNGSGQVVQQTDPMGRVTSFSYATNPDGSTTTTITEPNLSTTVEQFQNLLLTSITKDYGTPQYATWSYTYDPDTNGITSVTDPNQNVTHQTWDASGNLLTSTDPLARTTTNTYDAYGDLTSTTDPAGVTSYMTYDSNGNLLSTVRQLITLPQASPTPSPAASAPPAVSLTEVPIPTATGSATPSTPKYVAAGPDGNVWFTDPSTNSIGKAALSGAVTEYALPTPSSNPQGITAGPDNNLWFVEAGANQVARITTGTTPTITEYPLSMGSAPQDIVAGPDGNLWFTESTGTYNFGRITTSGSLTQYTLPGGSAPHDITVGADGSLWFTEPSANQIGRVTTGSSPVLTTYNLTSGTTPTSITAGPDGNLWFTETGVNKIGRITTGSSPVVTSYALYSGSQPSGIVAGPDGKLWITDMGTNQVIPMTVSGTVPTSGGYTIPTSTSGLAGITVGPDDRLWMAEGSAGQLAAATLAAVTTYSYDPNHPGDLTAITDPDGNTWRYTYDATTGNLLSSSDPLGDTKTLGGYDAAGRFTTVTSPNGNVSPTPTGTPVSYTSTIAYNAFGDITSITDPLLPGQSVAGQTVVSYDANRNRLSVLDQNNHQTQYAYDADNEQTGVTLPAGSAGSLSGSSTSAPASVNLTTEGLSDWAHWGSSAAPGFVDKATGEGQISTYTSLGGTIATSANLPIKMSWSDGTPTPTATNTQSGLYGFGVGHGYTITVPATAYTSILHLYVGLQHAQGNLTASLSDGSATPYTDTSFDNTTSSAVIREYTLSYHAASAGQTLSVTFSMQTDHGSGEIFLVAASLINAATGDGSLTGSSASAPGSVNLTTEGTSDWAHWGGNGAVPGEDDKATGGGQISGYSFVGGTSDPGSGYGMSMSWTDGTPTGSATNIKTGVYCYRQGSGYSITVPADTTSRTLHVYVGLLAAQGQFTASLSDNSAPSYVDTSFDNTGSSTVLREYTLTYAAASAGQNLTVTFSMLTDHGSGTLSLLAATLVGPAAPPTSTATATPTGTATLTNTATLTWTVTSTATRTSTHTPKPTNTATSTWTATATNTGTSTWTATSTSTSTITPTPTNTPVVPTSTPGGPTSTHTPKPTNTPTPTVTATSTWTATVTSTPTATNTATASWTATNTSTSTITSTPTNTATSTATSTSTITPTSTPVPPTSTHTPKPTNTATSTWTATNTATSTPSGTITPTPTCMVTSTATGTPAPGSSSYDSEGNLQQETDFNGHTVTYCYDPLNDLIGISQPVTQPSTGLQVRLTTMQYNKVGNRTEVTDPLGNVTTMGYDAANELTNTTKLNAAGTPIAVTVATYTADGQVQSVIDPNGHSTSYVYDSLGRLVSETDPRGYVTRYTYDLNGNKLTETDANGHTTAYGYDAANRLVLVTNPDSSTESTTYDADGNVLSQTDEDGHTTRFSYDALDRQIAMTDALSETTTSGYDLAGNQTSQTDALGNTTRYSYDQLNRLVAMADPVNQATYYGYDPQGNLLSVSDGNTHTTSYSYDDANEVVGTIQPDGSTLQASYDLDGNTLSSTDANRHTTNYTYDVLNHEASSTDPLGRVTSYVYDAVGNLKTLTDALSPSRTTTYGYDADDDLQSISHSDGHTPNVSYTYSPTDQRLTMTDGTGTTSYAYDNRDRLAGVTNGGGATVGYGYDGVGNVVSLAYPGGHTVTRGFDALNRLASVTDWLSNTTSFGYDANGNLHSVLYPNSTNTGAVYSYDRANGIQSIVDETNPTGTPAPFWTFSYSLDGNQQVRSATDPIAANGLHSYVRSKLDQLTGDGQTGGSSPTTLGLGYDSAYQLTSRSNSAAGTNSSYTADNADELTGLTTTTNGTTTQNLSFTYDRDGNRLTQSDSVSGASASYGYDQEDRLTSFSGGGHTASYSYDGDGLRQSKTVDSTTTTFTWDQSGSLPLLLQAGSTSYIDGPDGHPIEQITGSTPSYYLYDALGSVRGVLSATGGYTGYSYDPYGAVTSGNTPTTDYFGFAGEYTDAETGFEYLQARYYDPATGQFISVDPLKDLTGQPYAYTSDNPLSASDPTGLDCGLLQLVQGQCRLPTWGEIARTWQQEVRPDTYNSAVEISGFCDTVLFGLGVCSKIAGIFGANVPICSPDYQQGQLIGQGYDLVLQGLTDGAGGETGINAGADAPWVFNAVEDADNLQLRAGLLSDRLQALRSRPLAGAYEKDLKDIEDALIEARGLQGQDAEELLQLVDEELSGLEVNIASSARSGRPAAEAGKQPREAVPAYVAEDRVPRDNETILADRSRFTRTNIVEPHGATVYHDAEGDYYYRDTFHKGAGAEIEWFSSRGIHLGTLNPTTGAIIGGPVPGRVLRGI